MTTLPAELVELVRSQLQALIEPALQVLRDCLTHPDASPSVRLRAAHILLRAAGLDQPAKQQAHPYAAIDALLRPAQRLKKKRQSVGHPTSIHHISPFSPLAMTAGG